MAKTSGYTETLAKVAANELQGGETMLAAARGMSKGSTSAIAGRAAGAVGGGALGALIGTAATAKGRKEGEVAEEAAGLGPLPSQIALGVTDRRILIYARSTLSGKATDLIGEIPRSRVTTATAQEGRNPLKPHRLTITLDGSISLDFEIVRMDAAQPLADALGAT